MKISNKRLSAFLVTLLLFTGCVPSRQITIVNSWINSEKLKDRPVKKVYLLGLFKSATMCTALEHALDEEAKTRGYVVYGNTDEFPFKFDNPEDASPLILQRAKTLECDAIFVTAVKSTRSQTHYVSTSGVAVAYSGYYPMNGDQSNFNRYYTSCYAETSLSGYYETDKTYFIESNLYDVNTLELLWSVQSKSYNPTDAETVSKDYCDALFKVLEKEKDFRGRKQ